MFPQRVYLLSLYSQFHSSLLQAEGRKDTELAKAGPPPFVPYEIFLRTNPQRPRPKQPAATQRSSTKELHPQPKHQSLPPREDSKTLLHGDTGQKPQLGSNPTKTGEKDVTTGSGEAAVKGLGNQGVKGGGEDRFTKDSGPRNQRPSRDAPPAQSSQSGGGGRQSQGFRGERNGISMKWPAMQSTEGKKHSSDGGHNRSFQTQGTRGGEKNQRLQSDRNQRKGEQSGKVEQSQHSQTLQQKCDRAGLPSTQGHLTQKDRNHGGVPLTQRTQPQKDMETGDNPVSQNRGRADRYDPSTREKQRLQGHDAPRHWVQQGRRRERQWTAGSSGRPESSHHTTGESASQTVSSNIGSDSGGAPLTQRTQPQKDMETRDNSSSQNRGRADRYDPSTREKQQMQGHDAPRHWVQQGRWRERQWTAGSSGRPGSSHHATGESASQTVSSNVGSDSGGAPLTQRTQPQKDMETRDNSSSQSRGRADRYDPSTREKQQMQGHDAPRHWVQQGRWRERQWTAGSSGRPGSSRHPTGESASQTVSSNVGSDRCPPSGDGTTPKSQGTATSDVTHKPSQDNLVSIRSFSYHNRRLRNPPEQEGVRGGRSSLKAQSSSSPAPTESTSLASSGGKPERNVPYTATQVKKTHGT